MNNYRNTILVTLLAFLIIIITPNLLLFDIILYPLQSYKYAIASIISLLILIISFKNLKFKNEDILFYILIFIFFVSGVIKLDIKTIIFSFISLFLVLSISQFSLLDLKKFLKLIVGVLSILSIMGIFQIILYAFFGYENYITRIIRSIDSVKIGTYYYSFFTLLGGADSYYNFNGLLIPRFSAYVDQSSAVSIMMLFPASLYLIFIKELKFIPITIIFFSVFCLGMSTYLCLILSFIFFIFKYKFIKNTGFFIYGPFLLFFILLYLLYLGLFTIHHGDNIFEKFDFINNNILFDYIYGKIGSGIARISIISDGFDNLINYPWFGVPSTVNIGFGLIFLSYAQYYGILSSLVLIFIIFKIFQTLFIFYKENKNSDSYSLYGIFLLYSVFLELILYNDYAASRLWGLVFIFLSYKLFYLSLKVKK